MTCKFMPSCNLTQCSVWCNFTRCRVNASLIIENHACKKTRKERRKKIEGALSPNHSLALTLTLSPNHSLALTLTFSPNHLAKKLLQTTSLMYSLIYFSAMIYHECSTRRERLGIINKALTRRLVKLHDVV